MLPQRPPAARSAAPGPPLRGKACVGWWRYLALEQAHGRAGFVLAPRGDDDWIAKGWVKVNGEVAPMGLQVTAADRIEVDKIAQGFQEQRVTILLNKPIGYVSGQAEDGHTPAVALINPRTHWREDPAATASLRRSCGAGACGRLDIDSVGLLVLTQDGRVARQIIGEDSEVDKEYLVRVVYQAPGQAVPRHPGERSAPLQEIDSVTLSAPMCRRCSPKSCWNACAMA